jgi:site-specific DNA-methyltransferase (adenine-specific)
MADLVSKYKDKPWIENNAYLCGGTTERRNHHPTVKPTKLMRWLLRLVTPHNAVVLEPFAGSGTTLVAAEREGFKVIAAEISPEYCDIIRARVEKAMNPDVGL